MSHSLVLGLMFLPAGCAAMSASPPPPAGGTHPSEGRTDWRALQGFAPQRAADRAPDPIVAAPAALVHIGTPITEPALHGSPELAGLMAEVAYNAGHLERCWAARAAELPAGGEIVIHTQIDPSGVAIEQCVSADALLDPELRRCVNDLISMGRYPVRSSGNVDVTIPLRFSKPQG